MRKMTLGLMGAVLAMTVACGGGGPEGVAMDYVNAWSNGDMDTCADLTSVHAAQDSAALLAEKDVDEKKAKEALFGDDDNSIQDAHIVSVSWDGDGDTTARVTFHAYVGEGAKEKVEDRVEFEREERSGETTYKMPDSIYEHIQVELSLIGGSWKVTGVESGLTYHKDDKDHRVKTPRQAAEELLKKKKE